MARTIEDAALLIRDWTDASGCAAWRSLAEFAKDANRIRAYDESHPEKRTLGGEIIGGERNAAKARKAARQYRLASWVLRMAYEGRDARDREEKAAREAADYARIMSSAP